MTFLTSTRLIFRHWTEADLPLAFALWGDPEVARYIGGALSPEAAQARLQLEMERQRTFGVQYWPVFQRETQEFAGCAGLRPFHDEPRVFELGVHIARGFWSKRMGEEAARAVIRYAFDDLKLDALTAGHHPENLHSHALLTRLGFVYTHTEPWGAFNIGHPFYRLARVEAGSPRFLGADEHV